MGQGCGCDSDNRGEDPSDEISKTTGEKVAADDAKAGAAATDKVGAHVDAKATVKLEAEYEAYTADPVSFTTKFKADAAQILGQLFQKEIQADRIDIKAVTAGSIVVEFVIKAHAQPAEGDETPLELLAAWRVKITDKEGGHGLKPEKDEFSKSTTPAFTQLGGYPLIAWDEQPVVVVKENDVEVSTAQVEVEVAAEAPVEQAPVASPDWRTRGKNASAPAPAPATTPAVQGAVQTVKLDKFGDQALQALTGRSLMGEHEMWTTKMFEDFQFNFDDVANTRTWLKENQDYNLSPGERKELYVSRKLQVDVREMNYDESKFTDSLNRLSFRGLCNFLIEHIQWCNKGRPIIALVDLKGPEKPLTVWNKGRDNFCTRNQGKGQSKNRPRASQMDKEAQKAVLEGVLQISAAHSKDCETIVDKLLTHWGDVALSLLEHTKKEHRKGMDLAQVTDTLFGKANSSEICTRTSGDTADLQSISEALILYKARQMQENRAWFAGKKTTDETKHAKRGAKLLEQDQEQTTPAGAGSGATAAAPASTAAAQPQSANASSTEPKPKNAVVSARVVPKQNISCKVLAGAATGGGCCGGSKDDSEKSKVDFKLNQRMNAKTKKKEYHFGKSTDWNNNSLPVSELTFKVREDGSSFTVTQNNKPVWTLAPKTTQAKGSTKASASAIPDPSSATEWVKYLNDSKEEKN